MNSPQVPLWRQLQAAASVLAAVRQGESTTPALARLDPALRPAAQALAFQALRNLGRAEALRRLLAKRAPPPVADALLCTALALAWNPQDTSYEPFTLVDQTVEAAKRDPDAGGQANFINACLRRFLREQDQLLAATDRDPVARWNHPLWWIERLQADHPQHWEDILRANNSQAPMTLRVFDRKLARADYLQMLDAAQMPASPVGRYGVLLHRPRPVHEIPGFDAGLVSVQDAAAQLAAPLLLDGLAANTRPLRVLDACAAPGGKTAHLLEIADLALTALDVDPVRCERIRDTLRRIGLQASVIAADAARPQEWWDGVPFDAILQDAPCTASGIVRRHPDVRWLRRESDIAQLAGQQARLLDALWPLLAVGGRMLFCTCSVFQAEGDSQMQTFVAHNKDAALRPAPGHFLPQCGAKGNGVPDNPESDHDGFFYALLEKRSASPGQAPQTA